MNSENDPPYDRSKHYIATGILTIAVTILFLPLNHDTPGYLLMALPGFGLPSFFIAGWWEALKRRHQAIVAIIAVLVFGSLVPWFLDQREQAKTQVERERRERWELEDQYDRLSPGAKAELDRLRSGDR